MPAQRSQYTRNLPVEKDPIYLVSPHCDSVLQDNANNLYFAPAISLVIVHSAWFVVTLAIHEGISIVNGS